MPIFPYWLAVAAGGAADDGSIPRNPAGCGPPQPLPRHFSLYVGDMGLCGRSADWDLFVFITSRMYSRWSCASNSGPDATVDTWPGWPRRVLASCPGAARSSSRPRPTVSRRCRCLVRARCVTSRRPCSASGLQSLRCSTGKPSLWPRNTTAVSSNSTANRSVIASLMRTSRSAWLKLAGSSASLSISASSRLISASYAAMRPARPRRLFR